MIKNFRMSSFVLLMLNFAAFSQSQYEKTFGIAPSSSKSGQYLDSLHAIGTHIESKVICKQPNKFIGRREVILFGW
ncbi:MAG: hypothetical protein KF816_03475 [Melioribacteraceae bacterium]|nr:hypothetical protein [Melioribacteraceae bacterium]